MKKKTIKTKKNSQDFGYLRSKANTGFYDWVALQLLADPGAYQEGM